MSFTSLNSIPIESVVVNYIMLVYLTKNTCFGRICFLKWAVGDRGKLFKILFSRCAPTKAFFPGVEIVEILKLSAISASKPAESLKQ